MSKKTLPPPDFMAVLPTSGVVLPSQIASRVREAPETRLRLELGRSTVPEERRQLLMRLSGVLADRAKDYPAAISALEEASTIRDAPDVMAKLGDVCRLAGRFGAAARWYVKAAHFAPPDGETIPPLSSDLRLSWLRDGVELAIRCGELELAASALVELDENEASLRRSRAALHKLAPDYVDQITASTDWIYLADRAQAEGDTDQTREHLLRALTLDGTDERATAKLAELERSLGRARIADEVEARCANLRQEARLGPMAQIQRVRHLRAQGDIALALASALQANLDQNEGEAATLLDELFRAVDLHELYVARLELRAAKEVGSERARRFAIIARVCSQDLRFEARAVRAWAQALLADPSFEAAHAALAESTDLGLRVYRDTLVALLYRDQEDELGPVVRARCVAALGDLLQDPSDAPLLAWATEGPDSAAVRRVTIEVESLMSAVAHDPSERVRLLDAAAKRLRQLPQESDKLQHVLEELATLSGDDASQVYEEVAQVALRRGQLSAAVERLRDAAEYADNSERRADLLCRSLILEIGFGDRQSIAESARAVLAEPNKQALAVAWVLGVSLQDARLRAEAMADMVPFASESARGELRRASALALLAQGSPRAYDTARIALDELADPISCALLRASVARAAGGRAAVEALSRMVRDVVPWPDLCRELVKQAVSVEDWGRALAAQERLVMFSPGDVSLVDEWIRLALHARDPRGLRFVLARMVSEPAPTTALGARLAEATTSLAAWDATLGLEWARTALDAFGLQSTELRIALLRVAEVARDDAFAATILERWTGSGQATSETADLYLALAQRRSASGDVEGEARALTRAVSFGADPQTTQVWLEQFARGSHPLSGDARIMVMNAQISLAERTGEKEKLSRALREQGVAYWELLGERDEAFAVWEAAARASPDSGVRKYGADLVRYAGAHVALRVLRNLIDREDDAELAGAFSAEAARASILADDLSSALRFAQRAITQNPLRADALEAAEQGALFARRVQEIAPLYDLVAARARGKYGRRAAHYRAARFFEANGEHDLAVGHAAKAFVSVTSEACYGLMMRAAAKGAFEPAIEALEDVARRSVSSAQKGMWLVRAAELQSRRGVDPERAVDILLRALAAYPLTSTVKLLSAAAKSCLDVADIDRDFLEARLESACAGLKRRLEGPDGARVCLAFAELLLQFSGSRAGVESWLDALAMAGDLDEFASFEGSVAAFVATNHGTELVRRGLIEAEKAFSNVGPPALATLIGVARKLQLDEELKRLLLLFVERDDGLSHVLEAEAAIMHGGTPAERARFGRACDSARLCAALIERARSEVTHSESEQLCSRALSLAPDGDLRASAEAVYAEVREKLGMRAFESAIPASSATIVVAPGPLVTPVGEAARLGRLATAREMEGDATAALSLWLRAAEHEPAHIESWLAVERVAWMAGDDAARALALQQLDARLEGPARRDVRKRRAAMLAQRGQSSAAEDLWRVLLREDPNDADADLAVEEFILGRADGPELVKHLRERAARLADDPERADAYRAVRLRIAAVLEQRLGDPNAALLELQDLLKTAPGNTSVLRFLADMYEQTGRMIEAANLWKEIADASPPADSVSLQVRYLQALSAGGRSEEAADRAEELYALYPEELSILTVRVDALRLTTRYRELGDSLELYALASAVAPDMQTELLVEAAEAAARSGDMYLALSRAQRGAATAPRNSKVHLLARGLEYRLRGAGTPDEARRCLEQMSLITEFADAEDVALHAFLMAEAADVVHGHGAGQRILEEAVVRVGTKPLLCVGLGERGFALGEYEVAVAHFRIAVSGDLLLLRKRPSVAVSGALAAEKCGDFGAQVFFWEHATDDPTQRHRAERKLLLLAAAVDDAERIRSLLSSLIDLEPWETRVSLTVELARELCAGGATAKAEGIRLLRDAARIAPAGGALGAEISAALAATGERVQHTSPEFRRPSSKDPILAAKPVVARPSVPTAPAEVIRLLRGALDRSAPESEAIRALEGLMNAGSADAADLLGEYAERWDTLRFDRLRYRRVAAELAPGDLTRLAALRDAAHAEHLTRYTRALDHIRAPYSQTRVDPPLLDGQREQPGMLTLLTRHSSEGSGLALGALWDACQDALLRLLPVPQLGRIERVVPGPLSPLGRVLDASMRILDVPRSVIFRQSSGVHTRRAVAALGKPPSGIIHVASLDDSPESAFVLGEAISATLSSNVLLLGALKPDELWDAILRAFGQSSTSSRHSLDGDALVSTLWQIVPAGTQRHIQDLLGKDAPSFSLVLERAAQTGRRLGMFVSGDFHLAARMILEDFSESQSLTDESALSVLCSKLPSLADLYRLAIRPEYADARWEGESAPGRVTGRPSGGPQR